VFYIFFVVLLILARYVKLNVGWVAQSV